MAVQLTDTLYAERSAIPGKILVGDIVEIVQPLSTANNIYQQNDTSIFRAWERKDGTGYEATSYNKRTGLKNGDATGALPIPADIKNLNYS